MNRLFLACLLGALALGATAQEQTCETAACKTASDDLLHRSMNQAVNPCDDFYEYVCGNFEKTHPLDVYQNRVNAFATRNEQVHHELDAAFKAAVGSKSNAVKYLAELYIECNNTAHQESRGVKPLLDLLDTAVSGWPLLKDTYTSAGKRWTERFTQLFAHTGVSPIFRITVQFERHLGKKYLFIAPGGTGLGPEFLINPAMYNKTIDAYKQYIHNSAIALGAKDNAKLTTDVENIVHLETNLAKVLQQHPLNNIRLGSFVGFDTATKNKIDWVQTVNALLTTTKSTLAPFKTADSIAAVNLDFISGALEVLDQSQEEVIHNLFAWMVVSVFGPITTHKFREIQAHFNQVLSGVPAELPVPEFCFNIANSKLPFAMGRLYVDSHFTPEDKKEATTLVEEVKASFKKVLETNTWLDAPTKQFALEKLAAVKENVGYPDWVMSNTDIDHYYSYLTGLKEPQGRFFEAAVELYTLTIRHVFDELNVPINHTLMWPMTPATVNAAYMPLENSITIPAAVLNVPFFDKSRPFSMNYGAIGAIIGHEFTHGFDQNGRRFDLTGKEKDWWTNATVTEFTHRAQCFVKQYNDILDPVAELHLNGVRTLGENIADNGGIKEAFAAFHNHEAKYGKSPLLPGLKLNSDQLFYVSYARNWCSVMRKETLQALIKTNPHPPDRYRVNTVLGNSKEFSQTWNCPAGSKMNFADKCAVW